MKSTDQLQRSKAATFTLEMLPKQRYELSSYEPVSITAQPFSVDGPDLDPQGNETSMTVDTTVTVLEIQEEKIPEITDEWLAKHLPVFKSVADLRADIASKLEAETGKAYADYLAAARQINPQAKPEDTRKQLERSGRGFILCETAERYAATEYLLEHAGVEIAER